jgi:Tfp pilus assembly protein PilO
MSHLIPSQLKTQKGIILLIAAVMSSIAIVALTISAYSGMENRLEELEQQLFADQKNIRKLQGLRFEIRQQKQQISQIEQALFRGRDQDSVISTMQIKVQSILEKTGLEPESLRPVTSRKTSTNSLQSVVLKLRLNGNMNQFTAFLAAIYKHKTFFKIEGLTIKPFKQDQLKIYMDLRAYYHPSTNWLTKTMGRRGK